MSATVNAPASKVSKAAAKKATKAVAKKGGVTEKVTAAAAAAPVEVRPTIENAHSGVIKVEAKCKEAKELRAESKRGKLLSLLQTAKGAKQDAVTNEFGWKPRDFADALRLLAKQNGVNTVRDEKGVWHTAN